MVSPNSAQAHIAEEKGKIQVDSYQDLAFEGAWKGRSRAMWAIAVLGAVTGVALGAVAPLVALAAGATLTTSAVLTSIGIFSAIGMVAGFGMGATLGNGSGGSASVAKEQESRRIKSALLEHGASHSPSLNIEHTGQGGAQTEKGFKLKDYFNPKTMLIFAALGAIGGLVMAGGYISMGGLVAGSKELALPAMKELLGGALSTNAAAVTTYFTGVMAAFGAIFGLNYPKIGTEMTHMMGDLLGDTKTPFIEPTLSLNQPAPSVEQQAQIHSEPPQRPTPSINQFSSLIDSALASNTSPVNQASSQDSSMRITVRKHGSFQQMLVEKNTAGQDLPPIPGH